jgi:uncharacterized membrane protein
MATRARRFRSLLSPHRVIWKRPRLLASIVLGVLLTATFTRVTDWRGATCFLAAWDIATAVYMVAVFVMMGGSTVDEIRERAAGQDEGRFGILTMTTAAAIASLAAIVAEIGPSNPAKGWSYLVLAGATVLLSWTFIHTMFALHYAHEYYGERAESGGGLAFPGDDRMPDYWDFMYFSFVIGMTSQVSDVGITSKMIRRTAAAHGVVSFLFNVALLSLSVGVAGSMLSGS